MYKSPQGQISAPLTDFKLEINHKAQTVENTLILSFPYPGHPKYIHKGFPIHVLERTVWYGYSNDCHETVMLHPLSSTRGR